MDIVKIDVEGAEYSVLSGASTLLRRSRPVLMIELQESSLLAQGSDSQKVVELLNGLDYAVYRYAERGHPFLLRRLDITDAKVAQDVVAVPVEASDRVVTIS